MVDYSSRSIQFYGNDHFIALKGEMQQGPQEASLHQLKRLSNQNSIVECYTLHQLDPIIMTSVSNLVASSSNSTPVSLAFSPQMLDKLRDLLLQHQIIFSVPKGLPPSRGCNHLIVLQLDAQPVKVKPYRYPYS